MTADQPAGLRAAALTVEHIKLLRALRALGDRHTNTEQVYAAAFGSAALPGVQSAAGRLRTLARRGLVDRCIDGMVRSWRITDAGRVAVEP
ncbi:hypothetical protein [Azospirillum sp. TSO5]|uniref:hypothetical protein n=1 Tax=Azospirillum sp. TSO5 TaxID=716760 RepID=UPI000D6112F4|nr:hypothetical protein [Azospirillum sp. TSO5]PWC98066.1 hypothetical protein TSO5_03440 [Azospirillum sp. TSO5]